MIPPTTVTIELEPDVFIKAAEKVDDNYFNFACSALSNISSSTTAETKTFFADMLQPPFDNQEQMRGYPWYDTDGNRTRILGTYKQARVYGLLLCSILAREHNANVRRQARLVAKQARVTATQQTSQPNPLSGMIDCHSSMVTISASASMNDTHQNEDTK